MLEEENFINMYGYYGNLQRVLTTEKIKDLYGVTIATSNWEDYFRKVLSNPLSQASTAQQRDVNMEGTDCQAGLRTEQSIANAPAGTGGHDDLDTET